MQQHAAAYYVVLVMILMLNPLVLANKDEELEYPDIGILSSDPSDHYRAWGKTLLSDDWVTLVDEYDDYCKTYIQSTTLSELAAILVFSEVDLVAMTDRFRSQYNQKSDYFKSCNYLTLGPSFIQKLFDVLEGKWRGWEESELLIWGKSDAYIDTDYTLLLVKFLDKDNSIPFEQRRVSALFIRKDFQFGSNNRKSGR